MFVGKKDKKLMFVRWKKKQKQKEVCWVSHAKKSKYDKGPIKAVADSSSNSYQLSFILNCTDCSWGDYLWKSKGLL